VLRGRQRRRGGRGGRGAAHAVRQRRRRGRRMLLHLQLLLQRALRHLRAEGRERAARARGNGWQARRRCALCMACLGVRGVLPGRRAQAAPPARHQACLHAGPATGERILRAAHSLGLSARRPAVQGQMPNGQLACIVAMLNAAPRVQPTQTALSGTAWSSAWTDEVPELLRGLRTLRGTRSTRRPERAMYACAGSELDFLQQRSRLCRGAVLARQGALHGMPRHRHGRQEGVKQPIPHESSSSMLGAAHLTRPTCCVQDRLGLLHAREACQRCDGRVQGRCVCP